MNAIQALSTQPWVQRLGWTLLHFLGRAAVIYAAARKWGARQGGHLEIKRAAGRRKTE